MVNYAPAGIVHEVNVFRNGRLIKETNLRTTIQTSVPAELVSVIRDVNREYPADQYTIYTKAYDQKWVRWHAEMDVKYLRIYEMELQAKVCIDTTEDQPGHKKTK